MYEKSTVEHVPSIRGAPHSAVAAQGPRILVPLDGSVQALVALPVARTLAELVHGTLHLVHISAPIIHPRELLHKLGVTGEDVRGSLIEQACGDAALSLVGLTREPACACIVMCRHTGQQEQVDGLSSVARKVLRWSACPVVLVPPARMPRLWRLQHVLVPYDGKPTTSTAFGPALDLAWRAGASLTVLHMTSVGMAMPPEPGSITAPLYVDQAHHEWPVWTHEFLQRACCAIPPERMPALHLVLAVGEPAAEIVRAAQVYHADLIVLSWHGRVEGARARVARATIRQAACPVLLLRANQAG